MKPSDWISVKGKVPPLEETVLLWVVERFGASAISGWRETDEDPGDEDMATLPAEYSTDEWGTVTHWMPLPPGPEADDE
jgi:hypothetical protein